MKIQLEINGFDDRRNLAAILVDNGYKVCIREVSGYYSWKKHFIVEIEKGDDKNEP